jgi:hypothetical protein
VEAIVRLNPVLVLERFSKTQFGPQNISEIKGVKTIIFGYCMTSIRLEEEIQQVRSKRNTVWAQMNEGLQ